VLVVYGAGAPAVGVGLVAVRAGGRVFGQRQRWEQREWRVLEPSSLRVHNRWNTRSAAPFSTINGTKGRPITMSAND
jgi:hypothetical protein